MASWTFVVFAERGSGRMTSQSHIALVGGARNDHALSNKCSGFVQVQVQIRSKVKEFGTFWVCSGGGLAVDAPL